MVDEKAPSAQGSAQHIESAISDLFVVQDVTLGLPGQPGIIQLRGHLLISSDHAYPQIASRLEVLGYTALLRRDPKLDLHVLLVVPNPERVAERPRLWLNAVLFFATVLTTLYVGAGMSAARPPDDLWWPVYHLWQGWPFALSLLAILLAHELAHYFVSERYGVPRSLPYFIPLPIPDFYGNVLGTLGAVILMKGRVTSRRVMLDIGAAGPIAGLVVAIPVLLIGLSLSHVQPVRTDQAYLLEGNSLLYLLLKYLMFGRWLPSGGWDVTIHPVAFAGWAGLLVTSLNLIPTGQLDGGHIVYSILSDRARRLTLPIILILMVLGFFVWRGWFVWAMLVFFLGQGHPGPLDSVTELNAWRKVVGWVMLGVFLLTFTPVPLTVIFPETGQESVLSEMVLLAGVIGCLSQLRRMRWRKPESAKLN